MRIRMQFNELLRVHNYLCFFFSNQSNPKLKPMNSLSDLLFFSRTIEKLGIFCLPKKWLLKKNLSVLSWKHVIKTSDIIKH